MLDHISFPVSDYARAKAFYTRALAPLGSAAKAV
jgi:catechol 2,3-dioxygenase-like lactoylglutathione lyase family enzyme